MTAPPLAQMTDYGRRYIHPITAEVTPSVTTILSVIHKQPLEDWKLRTAAKYVNQNWEELSSMHPDLRIQLITEAHLAESTPKADLGDAVHAVADQWMKGIPSEDAKETSSYISQFVRFLSEFKPRFTGTEATVWSRRDEYAGTADIFAVIDGKNWLIDIKGLALDTPLPTPAGWTTMGAVRIGDELFDSAGRSCRVTAKSDIHLNPCYRLKFDEGSEIICDSEHRWVTYNSYIRPGSRFARGHYGVRETKEIAQTMLYHGQHHHRVPVAGALDLPERDLPVNPYVLGCWLGDGKATGGEICKPDDELFENIAACGYATGGDIGGKDHCQARTIYGLRTQLRLAGLLGHKEIPDIYLRASYYQRLALLQGLMDTDGTWNTVRHRAMFSSTDKKLSLAVRELLHSLGQKCIVQTVHGHGFGKDVTSYPIEFTPYEIQPFRLSRKAEKVNGSHKESWRRVIISAEPTAMVRTQCITVDSPDETYLCGESMIPTHNTGKGVYPEMGLQLAALANAEFRILPDGTELELPFFDEWAVLHLRPRGWKLVPVREKEACHSAFLGAREIFRFLNETAEFVLGEPL